MLVRVALVIGMTCLAATAAPAMIHQIRPEAGDSMACTTSGGAGVGRRLSAPRAGRGWEPATVEGGEVTGARVVAPSIRNRVKNAVVGASAVSR